MKNYLDLLDIDNITVDIVMSIDPIVNNGAPHLDVTVNNNCVHQGPLLNTVTLRSSMSLLDWLSIGIVVSNKVYSIKNETAAVITSLTVDGHELVDIYNCVHYISYFKDCDSNYQGFYLGYNGTWRFELKEPFYRWLHTATGQGWLLYPNN